MRGNNHHYFVPSQHDESEYFTFEYTFGDERYTFRSCPDVFSKDEVDYGSEVLIKTILAHRDIFAGSIMDMCCGYGTIGIILSRFLNAHIYMSDVNSTATALAIENVKINSANIDDVHTGDLFANIDEKYDHIVSNPPIKVGKAILFRFIDESKTHLNTNGTITVVIKKNLGAPSLKDYMTQVFGNCEIWERDKGYYILHSINR